MKKSDDTLRRFWNFCQQKRLPKAVLRGIPYIGSSIEEIIYGEDLEELIREFHEKELVAQQEIVAKLEAIMEPEPENIEHILVVGGANAEYVISPEVDVRLGRKHIATYREVIGGSGVNYSLRLINAGVPVLPILAIGKDRLGRNIKDILLVSARRAQLPEQVLTFIGSDDFFAANLRTPLATIIVEEYQRTIFSSKVHGGENFGDYLQNRVASLDDQPSISLGAVIIAHIHADSPDINRLHPGACTRHIIRSFGEECLVFGNFGNSQIRMGVDFWEDDLRGLSVIQLNLDEMRRFFDGENSRASLVEMVHWFRDRHITAIITLDKFGAVGTYKDGREGVILAWPFELEGFVDSTGAGDAFGAGLVSQLYQKEDFSFVDFLHAIGEARIWAAYACTTLGGAMDCPDRRSLQEFYERNLARQTDAVEVQQITHIDRILRILDKAY